MPTMAIEIIMAIVAYSKYMSSGGSVAACGGGGVGVGAAPAVK